MGPQGASTARDHGTKRLLLKTGQCSGRFSGLVCSGCCDGRVVCLKLQLYSEAELRGASGISEAESRGASGM